MPPRVQQPLADHPFNRWSFESEVHWLLFHRSTDGYILRFPDLADFEIGKDGAKALCWPDPSLDDVTRDHLFLNQVIPMMLSARGELVFHASAVETGDEAIAFMGPSGRGKSTLAASFALSGHPFLTDDTLVVKRSGEHLVALPSHPSVRMWDDSRTALLGNAPLAPPVSYTDKARMLAVEALLHCDAPRPLRAAFFLGEAEVEIATIKDLRGGEALAAWMRNVFVLDIEDRALVRRVLDRVADVVEAVPSIALDLPRDYAALPAAREAILRRVGFPRPVLEEAT
ncbi:hypothetical protein [Silicimonas algicola]|nr:hypothetical protein [Silicimonas algicola]